MYGRHNVSCSSCNKAVQSRVLCCWLQMPRPTTSVPVAWTVWDDPLLYCYHAIRACRMWTAEQVTEWSLWDLPHLLVLVPRCYQTHRCSGNCWWLLTLWLAHPDPLCPHKPLLRDGHSFYCAALASSKRGSFTVIWVYLARGLICHSSVIVLR